MCRGRVGLILTGSWDDATQSFKAAKHQWKNFRSGKFWRIEGRIRKLVGKWKTEARANNDYASTSDSEVWESEWESDWQSDRPQSLHNDPASLGWLPRDHESEVGGIEDWLAGVGEGSGFFGGEYRVAEHDIEIFESAFRGVEPSTATFETSSELSERRVDTSESTSQTLQSSSAVVGKSLEPILDDSETISPSLLPATMRFDPTRVTGNSGLAMGSFANGTDTPERVYQLYFHDIEDFRWILRPLPPS
ncbi:MAG: hypothetical protein MMC33_006899 [Icmadophila ericetorum]|nr:hypothetical protein [Icmadophila ericetorum]